MHTTTYAHTCSKGKCAWQWTAYTHVLTRKHKCMNIDTHTRTCINADKSGWTAYSDKMWGIYILRSAHLMGNVLFNLHLRKWRKSLCCCLDAHNFNSLLFVTVGALCPTPFTPCTHSLKCTDLRGAVAATHCHGIYRQIPHTLHSPSPACFPTLHSLFPPSLCLFSSLLQDRCPLMISIQSSSQAPYSCLHVFL